jgi:alkylation response protein AidB-like acyl-CoA dehydrogenase
VKVAPHRRRSGRRWSRRSESPASWLPSGTAAAHETGRCGWSGPLVATAGVAASLLATLDPEDESGLQVAIATDGRVVVVALHEDARGASLDTTVTVDNGLLTGRRTFVDSGTHASTFLVPARDQRGTPVLCVVDGADAACVRVEPMKALDPGRGLSTVDFHAAPARVVASGEAVLPAVRDAWLHGALLIAADALGGAAQVHELSCSYAGEREQFGRPVATFQSVKHKLVDMYAELETARSMLRHALGQAAADADDWRQAASAAKARVSDATMFVVREGVQVHGGIGFTWEHDVSHHFRRTTAARGLYGTPVEHRTLVAELMGF